MTNPVPVRLKSHDISIWSPLQPQVYFHTIEVRSILKLLDVGVAETWYEYGRWSTARVEHDSTQRRAD